MASLPVQALQGLAAPALSPANASDTTDLDPNVRVKIAVGGTPTTVTLTPVGPFIKNAPARVFTAVSNFQIDEPTWKYFGHKGRATYGRLDITTSQQTGVTTGVYTRGG
jgi:hypothetical protein